MKNLKLYNHCLLVILLIASSCSPNDGRRTRSVSEDDYRRAESYLSANTSGLVYRGSVRPSWIDDSNFWYTNDIPGGREFILVKAGTMTRVPAFDHEAVAGALSEATGETFTSKTLPFRSVDFSDDLSEISFTYRNKRYTFNTGDGSLKESRNEEMSAGGNAVSPDGRKEAFIRNYNLWLRYLDTGREVQLTYDGAEDFGYATNNAGWSRSDSPVLLWSPDSRRIATFRHDSRGVGEMYLATTNVGHPTLEAWKYPLPGDSIVFSIQRVIIDTETRSVARLKMKPDAHRSTISDHIAGRGGQFLDVEWSPDSRSLGFVSTSRDHRNEVFRVANPVTGVVKDIFEENSETFFESGYNMINWHYLPESDELLWFSRRSDWGHLYLYDIATGELKNQITSGDWNVLQVLYIDKDDRIIYFTGNCREPGDPYYQYLYSVEMDGSGLKLLTPEYANHNISFSPDGEYFTDSYSTPQEPPIAKFYNISEGTSIELERADITRLLAMGWQPPESFTVKARDGETDLYGLMHKPSNFDPGKKYPIINYIYPGPQTGSVGSRNFAASRADRQSIAELGFIVVAIDAMGTPMRSHSFHAAYYGNMGDNGLPDQITGMKQLAERYPWIDIDKVGIYGHSGGGFASTDAILRYPDFFKVAVSGAGNHDNRNYEDDWGEKWQGLLKTISDDSTNYDNQANQLLAGNLKGKLLLAHGTMDTNVPPYNTLLVVDALIAANKDFDLILFPNRSHGFGNENYMMRRRWDYFVKNLMGATPPVEFKFNQAEGRGR